MPPISVSEGIALIELERRWHQALSRSQRAAEAHFVAATCFFFGFVKFAYLVPVERSPDYEIVIWLASACLVLPLLGFFSYCLWQECITYEKLAFATGHRGAADGASWKERLSLVIEFILAGRK